MALKPKNQFKINEVKTENKFNPYLNKDDVNQIYIKDLINIKKTISTVPTFTPKKLIDQIQFYFDGSTTYRLYIYINNEWKYTTLS